MLEKANVERVATSSTQDEVDPTNALASPQKQVSQLKARIRERLGTGTGTGSGTGTGNGTSPGPSSGHFWSS